jgi:DNA-binding NarL/FixJ family response regulator
MKAGKPQNTPEVLWSKVDVKSKNECWPWKGSIENGYGRTWINDKGYYAHRVIFNLANPDMIELKAPTNKKAKGFLMHLCDNRICCNPNHLQVATLRENNLDMHQKGRVKHKIGGDHHRSVFTNQQIEKIMDLRQNGLTMSMIAEKMNANKSTIKSLIRRKS